MIITDFTQPNALEMTTVNDPVMGGTSFSKCAIEDGALVWKGEVQIVSFLNAPGFCILETANSAEFPSAILAEGLQLCFLIDTSSADSKILDPMSVQISTGSSADRNERKGATTYTGLLQQSDTKREDGLTEFCVPLNSDSFKATWRGQPVDTAPALSKDVLLASTQLGLSTYSSGKAGPFYVKLMSIYTTTSDDVEKKDA